MKTFSDPLYGGANKFPLSSFVSGFAQPKMHKTRASIVKVNAMVPLHSLTLTKLSGSGSVD